MKKESCSTLDKGGGWQDQAGYRDKKMWVRVSQEDQDEEEEVCKSSP